MRVVPVWEKEIAGAWPQAEVLIINDHTDVTRWIDRCAISDAPAVVAIFSQSKTRAFGRAWQPAVPSKTTAIRVPDLNPRIELLSELEEMHDTRGKLVAYLVKATGATLLKDDLQYTFFCPDCHTVVEAEPGSLRRKQTAATDAETKAADAEAKLEPVRSLTWFADRPRICVHQPAPLRSRRANSARRSRPITWTC
jgi:hypothetical protein